MPAHCRGRGCTSTELIRAHLTPQAFARSIKSADSPNLLVSPTRYTKKIPHGLFDNNILCADCDGFLNARYDNLAFSLLKDLDQRLSKIAVRMNEDAFFEQPSVDCNLLCGFVLSVLWRYSVSTLPDTSEIRLGPYQDRAREVLWGVNPLSTFPEFQVVCQRYCNDGPENTRKFISSPVDMKGPDFNSYGFSVLGFHFLAKVDRRPFPQVYRPFVLDGNSLLRGYFVDFHQTPQGRGAREMLAASRLRRKPKRR